MKPIVPVVLAGGIGERFWPLSRSSRPKQLLSLVSGKTMIEETFTRAALLAGRRPPLVITGTRIAERMKATLPKRLRYDMIVEPVGKNTAPALALAAAWIEARYGESIMAVLPADHAVGPSRAFVSAMRCAALVADKRNELMVFGVRPSRPETGYGYVELGEKTGSHGGVQSFRVARFIEKPTLAKAKRYCRASRFHWNSGMFVWKTSVLLEEVKAHLPRLYSQVRAAAKAGFSQKAIARFYRTAVKESIDFGIMERSTRVGAVAATFSWDDIGSWESLPRLHGKNGPGTTVLGDRIFERESRDTLIVNRSAKTVATIGCSGLGVFVTDDAVLVIERSRLPDLKKYLGEMKEVRSIPKELF